MNWLCRCIDSLSRVGSILAAIMTLCLVAITAEQVLSRYLFSAGSILIQELEWHLFGAIFLLAAASAHAKNAHVRVDIFYSSMPARMRAAVDLAGFCLFMLPAMGTIIYFGSDFTLQALSYESARSGDYWSSQVFEDGSLAYYVTSFFESWLRSWLLIGEASPNPDGLDARWILKSMIPIGASLLLLQGFRLALSDFRTLLDSKAEG